MLVPLILAYTGYAYWVFRGKIDPRPTAITDAARCAGCSGSSALWAAGVAALAALGLAIRSLLA